MSRSELLQTVIEAQDMIQKHRDEGRLNGQLSVDTLCRLYDEFGDLKSTTRSARSDVKSEIMERASESSLEDEDGKPVIHGNSNSAKAYATGYTDIEEEGLIQDLARNFAGEDASEEEIEEVADFVEDVIDLCGGFNVGPVKEKQPQRALKVDPEASEHRESPSRVSVKNGLYEARTVEREPDAESLYDRLMENDFPDDKTVQVLFGQGYVHESVEILDDPPKRTEDGDVVGFVDPEAGLDDTLYEVRVVFETGEFHWFPLTELKEDNLVELKTIDASPESFFHNDETVPEDDGEKTEDDVPF